MGCHCEPVRGPAGREDLSLPRDRHTCDPVHTVEGNDPTAGADTSIALRACEPESISVGEREHSVLPLGQFSDAVVE